MGRWEIIGSNYDNDGAAFIQIPGAGRYRLRVLDSDGCTGVEMLGYLTIAGASEEYGSIYGEASVDHSYVPVTVEAVISRHSNIASLPVEVYGVDGRLLQRFGRLDQMLGKYHGFVLFREVELRSENCTALHVLQLN